MTASAKILTITETTSGWYTVRLGDRWNDHLTRDEALYCVAVSIIRGFDEVAGFMKTDAEHATDRARIDTARKGLEETSQ